MPATRKIVGPRGGGFWSSFDPNNIQVLAEALKEEFQRSEPAHDIHFAHCGPDHLPPNVPNVKIGFHCLRDCLVFLLRGIIFIDLQGAIVEPGYAYVVKDEEWIGLGVNTTIFVMEEGEMKGICAQKLKEDQEKYRMEEEAARKKRNGLWGKVLTKMRRGEPGVQCATQ
ncbi:Fc.00g079210.m01.CDS01 [Cosmosporella sp. VM-42]